ncbi:hypothetical protein LSAT2_030259 [Lamellibrachia satsuma]|nr:hypothetical protein LSAT2_030259 [Lamellibrachia satsuma]
MWGLGNYCSGLLCVFHVLFLTTASHKADLCHPTSCTPQEDDVTFTELCHQHRGKVTGRCCVLQRGDVTLDHGQQIIGVDLRSCDIHTLEFYVQSVSGLYNKGHFEILMLDGMKECDINLFKGMTQLNYLSLPAKCGCPGGTDAWESSEIQHNIEICRNKTDICVTQNVTCPKNSHCVVHSPGVTWCTCNKDHYGYKCLRQGVFPTAVFAVSMAGCVIALSAVLWASVRRKVQ